MEREDQIVDFRVYVLYLAGHQLAHFGELS